MTALDFLFGRNPIPPSGPFPSPNRPIPIQTSTCGIQLGHYFVVTPVSIPPEVSSSFPVLALYTSPPSPSVQALYVIPATCDVVFGPVHELFRFFYWDSPLPPPSPLEDALSTFGGAATTSSISSGASTFV